MKPILIKKPPISSNWIHQVKYDGIRILCSVYGSSVELFTRKQKRRNVQYPELQQIAKHVQASSFILDGEVIVRNEEGKPQFSLVVRRDRTSAKEKIKQMMRELPLEYHVFDILMKDEEDLRTIPLVKRFEILDQVVKPNEWFHLVKSYPDGHELLKQMEKLKWEGIVSKDLQSLYLGGKSHHHWYKTKLKQQLLCVVGGVQYKNGTPNSLLLGSYRKEQLHFIGKASSGLTSRDLQLLHSFVPQLEQRTSPFTDTPVQSLPIRWIKPNLTLLVEYTEVTEENSLRHPKILGFTTSPPEKARWVT